MVTVREAMTTDVHSLSSENFINELIEIMSRRGIGSVVIVNENNIPIQIFTLRDIPKIYSLSLNENKIQELILKLKKNDRPLITIKPSQSLVTALNLMNKNEISHLPVVNKDNKLIGIISMRDLLKHFPSIVFTDSLTKVNNRMYLDMIRSKIERTKSDLGLMIIDIDNFKKINDTHGHSFGDLVLKKIAETLRKSVKSYDEVIRYGGEEFLVVLYRCNEQSLESVGNRLRNSIKRIKFPNHESLQVTVSIGCCTFKSDSKLQEIIEKADQALYRAKKEGKDRVICAR